MKRVVRLLLAFALILSFAQGSAEAAVTRIIVRVSGGVSVLQTICRVLGCTINYGLEDPAGQLFLVTASTSPTGLFFLSTNTFIRTLSLQLGVVSAELDVAGSIQQSAPGTAAGPAALYDTTSVPYYGATVRRGYVAQPASQIVRLAETQAAFKVGGSGIVAVIDTGVDPNHPALRSVLLQGRDFTRNRDGGDETGDVTQSTADVVDGVGPTYVNSSTMAVIDQSTADVVDSDGYSAYGHGTMVAGIVHLVAPEAHILPLKAFRADGTGYTSDAIRAIYWAVKQNAQVLNMSFSFAATSKEFGNAISFANRNDVIAVAAAGNDGQNVAVYPAAYANVMGVASTTNDDTRSSFSNYGQPQVWVAAPGEWIVTTYPWGTYAASSGTSFSAPFVAGAAALLLDVNASAGESAASQAIAHAKFISPDLGNGRLDLYQAVAAWRQAVGVR
jgi:subtilisin family serine protease